MTLPVLVVLGGLPGTGKTTLARILATTMSAAHMRIDTVEQAILGFSLAPESVAEAGYSVGYGVAADVLRCGVSVVADSVNPIALTRNAWREVAPTADVTVVEFEVVCSDPAEHRSRVESRSTNVPGLRPPTWAEVVGREYAPMDASVRVVDTAGRSAADCARAVLSVVDAARIRT